MITQHYGDCREVLPTLPEETFHCVVTSPPYFGLRSYSHDAREIGKEGSLAEYVSTMVEVARHIRRVLRPDGVFLLNLGDCYASKGGIDPYRRTTSGELMPKQGRASSDTVKPKNKLLVPHQVALALQEDGWYVRADMPWVRYNGMAESVLDRPTMTNETVFLLTKNRSYWWDTGATRLPSSDSSQKRAHLNATALPPPASYRMVEAGEHRGVLSRDKAYGQGRNYRDTDFWRESIEEAIDAAEQHLANLRSIQEHQGILEGDEPLAVFANTQQVPTNSEVSHFAKFPPRLVSPLIKAGCPRLCCPHCGRGWVRERERTGHTNQREDSHIPRTKDSKTDSTGWQPHLRVTDRFHQDCDCPSHDPVPGRVLDPFAGSGTTGYVAVELGRHADLIELNPAFAVLQDKRLDAVQPTMFDM